MEGRRGCGQGATGGPVNWKQARGKSGGQALARALSILPHLPPPERRRAHPVQGRATVRCLPLRFTLPSPTPQAHCNLMGTAQDMHRAGAASPAGKCGLKGSASTASDPGRPARPWEVGAPTRLPPERADSVSTRRYHPASTECGQCARQAAPRCVMCLRRTSGETRM